MGAMTVVLSLAAVVSGEIWMVALLTFEFAVRAAAGPSISPMGLLAARVMVRRSPGQGSVGPSSRLAHIVGLALSLAALALHLAIGPDTTQRAILGTLTILAAAEAIFGICPVGRLADLADRWEGLPGSASRRGR